ncbi:MAG: hypothetical protein KBT35_03925 [Firmicutes bacterium]|nr:hypothetical protein [Candidatus Colivicinus equi]
MKTKEELNELKQELETFGNKLQELSDEELSLVTGGVAPRWQWALGIIGDMPLVASDASSTAIYGSRGANGVILVTSNNNEE